MAYSSDQNADEHIKNSHYKKALEASLAVLKEKKRGHKGTSSHQDIADTYDTLAEVYLALSQIEKSLECSNKALTLLTKIHNARDERVGMAHLAVAHIHEKQAKYDLAIVSNTEALKIFAEVHTTILDHPAIANAMCSRGILHMEMGEYKQALDYMEASLEAYRSFFQSEQFILIGEVYSKIAAVKMVFCKYSEAIKDHQAALVVRRKNQSQFYTTHPYVGTSYNDLADVYTSTGSYKFANMNINKAIDVFSKIWNENINHIYMIRANCSKAKLYYVSGAHKKSLTLYLEALEKLNKKFGKGANQSMIADVLNSIGLLHEEQCQYRSAWQSHNEATAIRVAIYAHVGGLHPTIANGHDAIVSLLCKHGSYNKALQISTEAIEMRKEIYEEQVEFHPCIAKNHQEIGDIHVLLCQYTKALECYTSSLAIFEKAFAEHGDNVSIAVLNNRMGNVYRLQCKYDQAVQHYTTSMKIFQSVHRKVATHRDYADVHCGFASVYEDQGKYQQALESYEKAYEMRVSQLHEHHPDIPRTMVSIANIYCKMHKYEKAFTQFMETVDKFKEIYGKNERHVDLGRCYELIGRMHLDRREFDEAMEYLSRASGTYTDIHGKCDKLDKVVKHPDIARLHNSLGLLYLLEQKDLTEAWTRMSHSLAMRKDLYGDAESHLDIADSYFSMGEFHLMNKEYTKAVAAYDNCVEMREAVCGTSRQLKVADIYCQLGQAYAGDGMDKEALANYKSAVSLREAISGKEEKDKGLAVMLYHLGNMSIKMSNYNCAYHYFLRARKMFGKLSAVDESDKQFLANIYYNLGLIGHHVEGDNLDKAATYFEKAQGLLTELSLDHPRLAAIFEALGIIKFSKCAYEAALQLHRKALENRQHWNPKEDTIDFGKVYDNIGRAISRIGHYQSALEYFQKGLQIKRKVHGEDAKHTEIAKSYIHIGIILERAGETEKAFQHHTEALAMYEAIHVDDNEHRDIARATYNLGLSLTNQGMYVQALNLLTDALRMLTDVGKESIDTEPNCWPDIALCYQYLGWLQYKQGNQNAAVQYYFKANEAMETNDAHQPDVALNLFHIGRAEVELKQFDRALISFNHARAMWERYYERHPDVANCLREEGGVSEARNNYTEALAYYKNSLEYKKEFYPEIDKNLIICYDDLANIYRKLKKWDQCIESLCKALKIRKAVYDSTNHIEIIENYEALGTLVKDHRNQHELGEKYLEYAKKLRATQVEKSSLWPRWGPGQGCVCM